MADAVTKLLSKHSFFLFPHPFVFCSVASALLFLVENDDGTPTRMRSVVFETREEKEIQIDFYDDRV